LLAKRLLSSPFVAALVGGGIVAAVMLIAGVGSSTVRTVVEETSTGAPAAAGGTLSATQIYQRDAPGVVYITATVIEQTQSPFDPFPTTSKGTSTGSGFVISPSGVILTNAHVISGAVKIEVAFANNQTVSARVVGKDPDDDLALLKVNPDGLTLVPLPLGNSDTVAVGDPTYAIGNPFGLPRSLTTGVVSALQRSIQAPNDFEIDNVIQTDAPLNPGNSGGPLINAQGEVIGINSQIETGGNGDDGSVGIGFSIPINTAKSQIAALEKGGTVRGAYLGLTSLTVDGSLSALNLPVKTGALVQSVEPGTAAAKAGIRGGSVNTTTEDGQVAVGGDIIVKLDGEKVTIELWRAAGSGKYEQKTVTATLGERPNSVPNANTPEG
jgi:S1-C subfamily serine protease